MHEYAERPAPAFQIVPQQVARPAWHPQVGFVRWGTWQRELRDCSPSRAKHDVQKRLHYFQTCPRMWTGRPTKDGQPPESKEFPLLLLEEMGYSPCLVCKWALGVVRATIEQGSPGRR